MRLVNIVPLPREVAGVLSVARCALGSVVVVGRGGARNRSGPAPVEGSARSDARGYSLVALPAAGYAGPVPEFPLPRQRVRGDDEGFLTAARYERELELWLWAWRTPQACAWSLPSEAWRVQTVARWVRQAALCESGEAKAADHAQLHRYADQIGLTTAGLREMGWKVASDEVGDKRVQHERVGDPQVTRPRRLRAVGDDAQ